MHTTTAPPVDEVRRIAALESPVLRNLAITQCYAELAAAMAARGGPGANWCTFATWASRQAGSTIRGEDALGLLQARLDCRPAWLHPIRSLWRRLLRRGLLDPGSRLGRLTRRLHTPFDAIELAADAVARGNLKVFAEIGAEFARFLSEVPPDAAADGPELRAFLDGLRPGPAPDGQDGLRRAFTAYVRARAAPDAGARAELTLLANLEIGLHEQTRLQPEIRAALDAPHATHHDLGRRVLDALLPPGTMARRLVPDRVAAVTCGALAHRLEAAGEAIAREVITECLMVLALPGRVLVLSTHLPDPYPDALHEIADADLAELLARYEPVPPERDDCGARDWAAIEQRMHYIAHLFRAFHDEQTLFDAPFTGAQARAIAAGRIPDGTL